MEKVHEFENSWNKTIYDFEKYINLKKKLCKFEKVNEFEKGCKLKTNKKKEKTHKKNWKRIKRKNGMRNILECSQNTMKRVFNCTSNMAQ